jgi:hypothetical protein
MEHLITSGFKYEPLNQEASEIRLLTLLPGEAVAPIQCMLRVVPLQHAPRYEALSYNWGDLSNMETITVDHQEFKVTRNLETGLRRLRHSDRPRVLWVDAICINQNDITEKSIQVPLMGKLYTEASSVVVWLGGATERMETAGMLATRRDLFGPVHDLKTTSSPCSAKERSGQATQESFCWLKDLPRSSRTPTGAVCGHSRSTVWRELNRSSYAAAPSSTAGTSRTSSKLHGNHGAGWISTN